MKKNFENTIIKMAVFECYLLSSFLINTVRLKLFEDKWLSLVGLLILSVYALYSTVRYKEGDNIYIIIGTFISFVFLAVISFKQVKIGAIDLIGAVLITALVFTLLYKNIRKNRTNVPK